MSVNKILLNRYYFELNLKFLLPKKIKMIKSVFIIRSIQLTDIPACMKLSIDQGWNQTEKDWKLLIENPHNVCLLAESGHQIIGTTTAIYYSGDVAWIGMVLVDKEYRRQGISKTLLNNILNKLQSCKSIKLDATPEGQRVYKNFGFKEEYLITRMTIPSMVNLPPIVDNLLLEPILLNNINEIIALDEHVFGANRTQLIQSIITNYPQKAWLFNRNDSISGLVLGRVGKKYHHIGPLIASTFIEAKTLISKVLKQLENKPIVVDIPSDKVDLINWLQSLGFIKQRHFVRMYRDKNSFPGLIEKQFLICGPEFG